MTTPVPIHQFLPTLNPGDAIGNVVALPVDRSERDGLDRTGSLVGDSVVP